MWAELKGHTEAIRSIHISERGRFGAARIDAADEGVPALGYTVENAALGRVLWERLASAPRLTHARARACDALAVGAEAATAVIEPGEPARACAARSRRGRRALRRCARRSASRRERARLRHSARVIFNCSTEAPLDGRAYERFTPRGPIAFLPLTAGRAAVIWTLPTADAERIAALPADDFRAELQAVFGFRLGRIGRIGDRHMHALARIASDDLHRERAVLIGDAALRLHPVAGQGFNLALRDVATLAEVIADSLAESLAAPRASGAPADVGAADLLERYRDVARGGSAPRVVVHARLDPISSATPRRGSGSAVGSASSRSTFCRARRRCSRGKRWARGAAAAARARPELGLTAH